ncbi:uncharacterized protein LOC108733619 [Agrilus planipennis]|uniref:Uncharacterized protein LOC108733619 n=1 Tax=Agrilus planipennis TaxID=224129 RepID=A0A1W4W8H8_AGRPL|nr:uncharacterized protein LOC108733619 [Agrilus planipennis]
MLRSNEAETEKDIIENEFLTLTRKFIASGLKCNDIQKALQKEGKKRKHFKSKALGIILVVNAILYECGVFHCIVNYAIGIRCLIPNNYFVWEATRPVSDCSYCLKVAKPIVLPNLTQEEFAKYAYSSKPLVIKGAFLHWPALNRFDYYFFKELYESVEGSFESVDQECQFLHFKSDFISIRDIFSMHEDRVRNLPGQKSWYVGWGNCHPKVLEKMRKYYEIPHFLPEDCELSSKEYVFMGYDAGATLHLDFINRLMWQAQLKGSKTWYLSPTPECEDVCSSFSFLVEPGDAVLVDTRIWYHGTTVKPGDFSLSIQSEYG